MCTFLFNPPPHTLSASICSLSLSLSLSFSLPISSAHLILSLQYTRSRAPFKELQFIRVALERKTRGPFSHIFEFRKKSFSSSFLSWSGDQYPTHKGHRDAGDAGDVVDVASISMVEKFCPHKSCFLLQIISIECFDPCESFPKLGELNFVCLGKKVGKAGWNVVILYSSGQAAVAAVQQCHKSSATVVKKIIMEIIKSIRTWKPSGRKKSIDKFPPPKNDVTTSTSNATSNAMQTSVDNVLIHQGSILYNALFWLTLIVLLTDKRATTYQHRGHYFLKCNQWCIPQSKKLKIFFCVKII